MTFEHFNDNASDRLFVALGVAVLVHAGLLFGLKFKAPEPPPINRHLDIELVEPTTAKPENADYLAQANSAGGGVRSKPIKPQLPPAARAADKKANITPRTRSTMQSKITEKRVLTLAQAKSKLASGKLVAEPSPEPRLNRRQLANQIAQLGIAPTQEAQFSANQKVMPLHAITAQKYIAAAYERAWQKKVERIGNLNYPDEARRKKLSGNLLISVWIAKDGSVKKIKVHRSSGHRILDDAAVRIVRLAAPFAPLPEELARQADVIVITRTWKFEAGLAMGS